MRRVWPRPAGWTDREYRSVLILRRVSGWSAVVAVVSLTASLLAAGRWMNAATVVLLGASWLAHAHGERYRNAWPVTPGRATGRYATRREGSA